MNNDCQVKPIELDTDQKSTRIASFTRIIALFPSSALLFAGSVKLVSVFSVDSYFDNHLLIGFKILVSFIEILVGVALLTLRNRPIVMFAGIGLFLIFGTVTFYKLFTGVEDCGCFGRIKTHPAISSMVNVMAIFILTSLPFHRRPKTSGVLVQSMFSILAFSLILGFTVRWAEEKKHLGETVSKGDTIVVSVNEWKNKAFPIASFIQGPKSYLKGTWDLLFFSKDCGTCKKALREIQESESNIAIIEIPPYGYPQEIGDKENSSDRLWLRLSADYDWLVQPAARVTLVDGIVVE